MADINEQIASLAAVEEEGFITEPSVDIFNDEANKVALIDYLATEIDEVGSDAGRTVRMDRNTTIKRHRLARPESDSKDFPWPNASNITPPMALQKTNIVTTRIINKLKGKDPLIKYEADKDYKEHAEALTRFMQMQNESPYAADLYSKLWNIVYDTVSLGTKFVKIPFETNRMRFNRLGADGAEEKVDKIIKASASIKPLPMEDFLTRPHWTDIQTAPWIGVRYYKFKHELQELQAQGFYTNVDAIITETGSLDIHKQDEMALMGVDDQGRGHENNDIYEIYEINVFWDADGDGFAEDIIVHIEPNSKTILRAEYNDLGIRDYVRIPHIDIPGNLYALGVGDIMIPLQEEAEALHNMRNDATQLAILPIVVTSENSSMGQKQELYPGKFIKTANPREDIIINKFPNVGPDALQAENAVENYANKATGASDGLGGEDVGGSNRIGATGTQFLAGQSLTYLDAIASQMDQQIAEIGLIELYQTVKNSEFVDLSALSEKDQVLVSEVLSMNVEDIPSKFKFQARLSQMSDSPQSKQQEAIQLFQVYMAYGDKMSQIAAQMANPQMAQVPRVVETMQTYFVGISNLMGKILGNFDEDNVQDYLPFVQDLEATLRAADLVRTAEVEQIEARANSGQGTATGQSPVQNVQSGSGGIDSPSGNAPDSVPSNVQNVAGPEPVGGPAV